MAAESAGEVITEFLAEQLSRVRERRAALRTQGNVLLTGCIALLAFNLALLNASVGEDFSLSLTGLRILACVSLGCIPFAVVLVLLATGPRQIQEAEPSSLAVLLEEPQWSAPADRARRQVARALLNDLEHDQDPTTRMGKLLRVATWLLGTATSLLSAAIVLRWANL